jgi:hypothetical protein
MRVRRRRPTTAAGFAAAAVVLLAAPPVLAQVQPITNGNVVVSVIDGTTQGFTLTTAPVTLAEYTSGGALVQELAVPATVSLPGQHPLLCQSTNANAAGEPVSVGLLSRSTDGKLLTLSALEAAVGSSFSSSSLSWRHVQVSAAGTATANTRECVPQLFLTRARTRDGTGALSVTERSPSFPAPGGPARAPRRVVRGPFGVPAGPRSCPAPPPPPPPPRDRLQSSRSPSAVTWP